MKEKLMKMIKSIDWLSIITLTGIIMSFLILDIGVRYFTGRQISFYPTLKLPPLLFTLSYIGITIFVIYKLPKKLSNIFYGIIYGFFWFFALAQIMHFKILNKFFTINDLVLVDEANKNLNFVLGYFDKRTISFFSIALLIGIVNIILIRKSTGFYNLLKKKTYIVLIILSIIFIRVGALILLGNPVSELKWDAWNYPRNIYNNYNNSNRSLRVSGIYEYLFRDIYVNINKKFS